MSRKPPLPSRSAPDAALTGAAIDTLYKLGKAYPHDVDAGDVPSKSGRDELLRLGWAEYVPHEGTTHLTVDGFEAYKKRSAKVLTQADIEQIASNARESGALYIRKKTRWA